MEKLAKTTEKAHVKVDMNLMLLAAAFTVFTFIGAVNPDLLKNNVLLSAQLTLAIPFLSSSTFARSKLIAYEKAAETWELYGFFTFIFGYAFLVNAIGLMLSDFTRPSIGIVFWILNIISAVFYSALEISEHEATFWSRAFKDALFTLIIVFGGILPVLKVLH